MPLRTRHATYAVAALVLTLIGTRATYTRAQTPQPINPVGTYSVSTFTDEGQQMSGTLTVRAGEGGYTGELVSPEAGTVPLRQVTTNATNWIAMFTTTDNALAVAWLQRQPDGTFTGTWHQLSPGINVKMTKTK
ncbi:MAG: hypothetical protein R2752_10985 [Vicinamibacterales bacterium]